MNWIRRHPLLAAFLFLVLPAAGMEIQLVRTARRQAQRTQAGLDLKNQERDRLARLSPAPSEESERAVGSDLVETGKVLRSLQTEWLGEAANGSQAPTPIPVTSIEAYFDLAAFVERTRALAARAQVQLKPAEYFGFKSYASKGPEPELVSAVVRQRVAAQHLVEALIAAQPQALLMVQREHPVTAGQRTAGVQSVKTGANRSGPTDATSQPEDFFELPGQISLRSPGLFDGEAIRLEFSGQTETLRAFLNALASSARLIVVRSVEAEPLAADAQVGTGASGSAVSSVPLVARTFSKFVVVVEYVVPLRAPEELAP